MAVALQAAPHLTRNYTYRFFTTRDGLVQMQVMCTFQDRDGYMWFGTKGGVSRWDGKSFKNYTTEDGLPLGETVSISEWGKRKLIFTSRKMSILEQNDSIFVQNLPDKIIFEGLCERTIAIDNDNFIILGLCEEFKTGLIALRYNYIYNIYQKKFTPIRNFHQKTIRVLKNHVITSTGLYEWTGKALKLKLKFPYEIQDATFDLNFKNCGLVKVKTNKHELFKITNGKFISVSDLREGGLERSVWLQDGTFLWLYYSQHHFTPQRTRHLLDNFTYPNFSFVDRENNLWIGTENGLYNFFHLNIEEYNFNIGTPDNIWSVVEDNFGTFWFGSYGNGLYTLDKNEKLKHLDFSRNYMGGKKMASKLLYMSSTTGIDGSIYITNSNGVARFVNGNFKNESDTRACLYAYFDQQTNQIIYSGIDTTTLMMGLYIGMDANKKFYPFEKGLPICILRDGNGVIRVGAFRGTGRLKNEQLLVDTVKREYTSVVSMALDNQKRLWKATEKGIYVELDNGKEFRVSEKQLTGAFTSLVVYKNKYLIAGGTHGFVIIEIDENTNYENIAVINIGYESGFTGLESGQNGIFIDSQGYVWLTTALNVLKFNPEQIVKNHLNYIPTLRISNISYSTNNTDWASHFFNEGKAVKLSSDNKFFRIDYIANSISAPKSLRFKYRLIGLSDKWSDIAYTKSVNYTNIGYGKYRFEVQCSLDGIHWTDIVRSPEIEITAPFYLRPFAFLVYIILLIALIIIITRIIIWRKQKAKIDALERQKLENELHLKTLRSKIIPHFTNNVLTAIGHFSMTDRIKAGYYISIFSKFTGLTLANADKNYVNLSDEIEYIQKYLELEKMRFGDKFEFEIKVGNDVSSSTQLPAMTLHTYCDNAIRHGIVNKTGIGKVTIVVTKQSEGVLISISDNGIGRTHANDLGTHGNGKGLKLVEEQINFYNQANEHKMKQTIIDLRDNNGNASGTRVDFFIPDGFVFD